MDEQEKSQALSQNAKPVPTWFFERQDGKIFACSEEEAWNMQKNTNRTNTFKMIGQSDGKTYFDTIKQGKREVVSLAQEKLALQTDLNKYLQTEDDLRFKQLKDDTDEMVIKVVSLRNELTNKIVEIDKKLSDINTYVINKAFNAELEKARGNLVRPKNQDVIVPVESDRDIILNNLGIR